MIPIISVIIPVYNSETCIYLVGESILKQTFQDFEVIFVDDGSTDSSLQICKELSKSNERVKVIHQANSGVSTARNIGLDNANGEYIAFVDSDDLISQNYLEYLLSGISGDTVLTTCSYTLIHNYNYQFSEMHEEFEILPVREAAKKLLSGYFPVCVWGGLFKRSLIGDLRFPVGIRNNEDKLFLYQYLLKNEKGTVAISRERLYGYMVREGSTTRSSWNGSMDIVTVAEQIRVITEEQYPEWIELINNASMKARFDVMKSIVLAGRTELGEHAYHKLKEEVLKIGFPKTGGRRLQIQYIAALLGKPIFCSLTRIYYKAYSNERRFRLNERIIRQEITE